MTEFCSRNGSLPEVPDDLTLVQFMLDADHSTRPNATPGVPWLIEDDTGKTMGKEEIRTRVSNLANGLSMKYNLKEDDVVVIFSPNQLDYPLAIWAIHRLGAIVSGANPTFKAEELEYQIKTTGASLIIAHSDTLSIAEAAARSTGIPKDRIVLFDNPKHGSLASVSELIKHGSKREPVYVERKLAKGEARTKLAFLSFSSGTTGRPKAVAIPHFSPIVNVVQLAVHNKLTDNTVTHEDRPFRPGDKGYLVLPMYHAYGLIFVLHFFIYAGMSILVVPRFNFEGMLKSIVRHRITHLPLVPPQAVLLCKHPIVKEYDLKHVRCVMVGAAPVSAELTHQMYKLFPNAHVGQGLGTTETATMVSMFPVSQKHAVVGSAGQLISGITARVVKRDGTLARSGEAGELVVKSPASALGYLHSKEATESTFVNGWVHTGDEVVIDEQGEMFVVDRIKEFIKTRAYQVAPAELEGFLLDHPDIADVCVVGVPDEYSGEIPLAFVILSAHAARDVKAKLKTVEGIKTSICKYVADNKAPYKQLAGGVEFVDSIPRNPSGKLLRRVLRDHAKEIRTASKAKL